jgi:5'/3'-nucleotidase SurE
LLGYRPDLVVSGINNGANMGDDTIYSGTVGAAMEAYLFGIPAIAFSQTEKGWAHLDVAAAQARALIELLRSDVDTAARTQTPWLLNVNIPTLPADQIKGVQVVRAQACGRAGDHPDQPARRDHVLDRQCRTGQRRRRGHRLLCHAPWPCFTHPLAGGSDGA